MKIQYDFSKNEDIIKCLEQKFPEFEKIESQFSNDFPVSIIFSDELPPILEKWIKKNGDNNNEKLSKYPIDELLGSYNHKSKIIIIYLLGIQYAVETESENMGYSKADFYQHLLKIVILHELGHYWFYNFIEDANFKHDTYFTNDICKFDDLEYNNKNIHEWIAQMFAYLCLENEIEKTFMKKFADKQPTEYKSFLNEIVLPICDFKEIAGLLHLGVIFKYISNYSFTHREIGETDGFLVITYITIHGYFQKISKSVNDLFESKITECDINSLDDQQYSINDTIQNHSKWKETLKKLIEEASFLNVVYEKQI